MHLHQKHDEITRYRKSIPVTLIKSWYCLISTVPLLSLSGKMPLTVFSSVRDYGSWHAGWALLCVKCDWNVAKRAPSRLQVGSDLVTTVPLEFTRDPASFWWLPTHELLQKIFQMGQTSSSYSVTFQRLLLLYYFFHFLRQFSNLKSSSVL